MEKERSSTALKDLNDLVSRLALMIGSKKWVLLVQIKQQQANRQE